MFNCARIIPRRIISSDGERYLRGRSTKSPARDRGENNKSQRAACFDENRTEREARKNAIRGEKRGPVKLSAGISRLVSTCSRFYGAEEKTFPSSLPPSRAREYIIHRAIRCARNVGRWARCASDNPLSYRFRGAEAVSSSPKNALARLGLRQDCRIVECRTRNAGISPVRWSDSLAESGNCTSRTPKYSPTRSLRRAVFSR